MALSLWLNPLFFQPEEEKQGEGENKSEPSREKRRSIEIKCKLEARRSELGIKEIRGERSKKDQAR